MTEEELNSTDTGADSARSSLADAIAAVEAGGPVQRDGVADAQAEVQAQQAAHVLAEAEVAHQAQSARSALEAAVMAAEAEAAKPVEYETEPAEEPEAPVIEPVAPVSELDSVPLGGSDMQVAEATEDSAVASSEAAALDDMIESLGDDSVQEPVSSDEEPQGLESEEALESEDALESEAAASTSEATDVVVVAAAQAVEPAPAPAAAVEPATDKSGEVALWPFLVYFGIWIVYTGLFMWRYLGPDFGEPTFADRFYLYFMVALVALVITGPIVALATWMSSWDKPGATRSDLLVSALVRGSVATFGGISVWFIGYFVLDLLRMSRAG